MLATIHGKFIFISMFQRLTKWARIEIGHAPTTMCDFDTQPAVRGYKNPLGGDVFYCCQNHAERVERG